MNSKQIISSSIAVLIMIVLVYFFVTNKGGNKYQWWESYRADSNQPYGTMFMQKLLSSSHTGKVIINSKEPVHKVLEDNDYKDGKTDYVLIGQSTYFDALDIQALKDFMYAGNDVFIASVDAPDTLVKSIYTSPCDAAFLYDYATDTAVLANFYHEKLSREDDYVFRFRIGAEDHQYPWRSLDYQVLCDTLETIEQLGYQQGGNVNFMRIKHGEGYLYLHTAPLMFSNYHLTNADKMEYASAVFSHMSGDNLIWDEVSKVPFNDMQNPYDSPLYYILQQPALKYAWWMLLVGGVLYVIFASKRTQRVIPVIEAKSNTSLEFLNVISSLHYQNPNHLDMARKKMKYFLYFIRAKYGINTQSLTEEQTKRLAEKSKVSVDDIKTINDRYRSIENYATYNDDPDLLVKLYESIEKFYTNCK